MLAADLGLNWIQSELKQGPLKVRWLICTAELIESPYFQVNELNQIMSKNMGVMHRDGNFKIASSVDTDSIIQISDDEENPDTMDLKCRICEYTRI